MSVIKFRSLTIPTALLLLLSLIITPHLLSSAFQSDELLLDDEEFEGVIKSPSDIPSSIPNPNPNPTPTYSKKRSFESDSDSKIQFTLEHAFGDSDDFETAGVFSARLKTWATGGQTLTKLRFSRDSLSEDGKERFNKLLEDDDFYKIRLPSNVLSPPGREYVVASVKARCLPREALDEHFVIHMDGVNILSVSYGSPGSCQYPRLLKRPSRWSFNSYPILKSSEQAPRAPAFAEEIINFGAEVGDSVIVPPSEKSFWAKYWMYAIPLGLIIMNAVTQAMNLPEEQAPGQPGGQPTAAIQRPASQAGRRR